MSEIVLFIMERTFGPHFIISKFSDITLCVSSCGCFSAPAILFTTKEVGTAGPIDEGIRQAGCKGGSLTSASDRLC